MRVLVQAGALFRLLHQLKRALPEKYISSYLHLEKGDKSREFKEKDLIPGSRDLIGKKAGYFRNRMIIAGLFVLSSSFGLVLPSYGEANLTGPVYVMLPGSSPFTGEAVQEENRDGTIFQQEYPEPLTSLSPDTPPHPDSGVEAQETATTSAFPRDIPLGSGDLTSGGTDDFTTENPGQAVYPVGAPGDASFPYVPPCNGYQEENPAHSINTDGSPGEDTPCRIGEERARGDPAPTVLTTPALTPETPGGNENGTPGETGIIPPGVPEFSQESISPCSPLGDAGNVSFQSGGEGEMSTALIRYDNRTLSEGPLFENEKTHAMVTPALINGSSLEEGGWLHITLPGAYILMADIIHSSPVGILIEASGVRLDGQGHVVKPWNAPYGSQGISIAPVTAGTLLEGIRVSNITIMGESTGLGLDSLSESTLEKITLNGNSAGMTVMEGEDLLIQDFSANGNTEGITMVRTSGITMNNSSITGSVTGIRVESGENDLLSGITVNGSRGSGIVITGSRGEKILSSTIDGGTVGFSVQNSEGCSIEDSVISGTGIFAASVGGGRNTTLLDTTLLAGPGSIGIRARGDNTGTIIDSCKVSGGAYGVVVDKSTGLVVNNTTLSRISADGVSMQDSRNPVLRGLNIADTVTGFRGLSLQSLEFSDSTIQDSREAIVIQGLHGGTMSALVIENCSDRGISVISTSALTMSDNRIYSSGTGIAVVNSPINISTSRIDGVQSGISMMSSHNAILLANTIEGSGSGVTILNGNGSLFLGNTLSDNALYGISIQDSPGVVVSGNRFDNVNNTWMPGRSGEGIIWNTTRDATGLCSPFHGGNTWESPGGHGYSQDCMDSDKDGFCDTPLLIPGSGYDMLPLACPTLKPIPTPVPPGPGSAGGSDYMSPPSWEGIPGVPSWQGNGASEISPDVFVSHYSFEGSMEPGTTCLGRVSFRNTGHEPLPTVLWVEARFDGFQDIFLLSPEASSKGTGSTWNFSGPVTLPSSGGPWTLWIQLKGTTASGGVIMAGAPVPIPVVAGKNELQVPRERSVALWNGMPNAVL